MEGVGYGILNIVKATMLGALLGVCVGVPSGTRTNLGVLFCCVIANEVSNLLGLPVLAIYTRGAVSDSVFFHISSLRNVIPIVR